MTPPETQNSIQTTSKHPYIIVGGPQASGKSTLIRHLRSTFRNTQFLQETRQIVVRRYDLLGAIFMSEVDELEIIYSDLLRLTTVIRSQHPDIHVDETSVFTLGHARAHGIDLLEGYFSHYCKLLSRLTAGVIFLDARPAISWERRKARYEDRLLGSPDHLRTALLAKYREYLFKLHPELCSVYEMIAFPKRRVNSETDQSKFLADGVTAFADLLSEVGVTPEPRVDTEEADST